MSLWRAITECWVCNTHVPGNGIVSLTEEQESELKLGKFAEAIPDQKALRLDPSSKKTILVGNKNLVKVSKREIENLDGKPLDDGLILYPPPKGGPLRGESQGDGIRATVFENTR